MMDNQQEITALQEDEINRQSRDENEDEMDVSFFSILLKEKIYIHFILHDLIS